MSLHLGFIKIRHHSIIHHSSQAIILHPLSIITQLPFQLNRFFRDGDIIMANELSRTEITIKIIVL